MTEEARKSHLVDIRVNILRGTDRAVLVDDGKNQEWLPLSQIEVVPSDDGRSSLVTLPEWLAQDKGLI